MTVFFSDGTIISGSCAYVSRAIQHSCKWERDHGRELCYWFSRAKCTENYKKYGTWD